MHTKLDEAKAELLTRAARVADSSPAGALPGQGLEPQAVQGFLQHYYLHTSPEDEAKRKAALEARAAQPKKEAT